jgi:hypothetical protein
MNSAYFVTNVLIPLEEAIFLQWRAPHESRLVFIAIIAQFTQIVFQKIGLKHTILSACHSHPIHLIWFLVTSTCFLQSEKTRTDSVSWQGPVSWVPGWGFEESRSTKIEYHISGLGAPSSKTKWKQWRLCQMVNNLHIDKGSSCSH